MGGQGQLAISVETHPTEFQRVLDQERLVYTVFRSRQRWVFLTDFVPHPAAQAASRFLHTVLLPEMLLEHLDARYGTVDPDDRLTVWRQSLPLLEQPPLARGTAALLLPELVQHRRLSILGWLRFRGERFLRALVAELARTGLQQLWLERALRQYLGALRPGEGPRELWVEGVGARLVIREPDGPPLYREFLQGHLDPRVQLEREDLAVGLLRALAPQRIRLRGTRRELAEKLRQVGLTVEVEPGSGGGPRGSGDGRPHPVQRRRPARPGAEGGGGSAGR
ncbi:MULTISPECIES: hypothetical protein [Thermaerobacter]|uniref:Uncharacterized protein n=1 Tax=Thermaerobacter composti TaxID=554949 RepID=A0ABZ0QKN4_9FIRM|nr:MULTISPECIES: hypothetical protein [Thermaerobacter]QBS38045.1 hypothetical protein E1B22_10060 [Thermaerobacter sp. FW80]WPD18058.1 hypothetical protein Q5761_06585 [Thermaerobacter composti]